MIDSKSLRLVTPIARHERLRSQARLSKGVRLFSIHSQSRSLPRQSLHRTRNDSLRTTRWQQSRSLSLFGWGSSKAPESGFSENLTTPETESWPQPTPVKAVHATTDSPSESGASWSSSAPHTPEPVLLHDIENAIAAPHASAGTTPLIPTEIELASIPERIGYLKEVCGLDYGWGPAATMQFLVEHLHIDTGMTWGAAIVASAILVRLCVFKLSMNASNISIRMKQMQPHMKPLQEESKVAAAAKDNQKLLQLRTQMSILNKEYGIKYSRLLLPAIIQIPLSFGGFRLYRGMSSLPVPALETEEWLWATDLTQSDPLVIVPFISAACLYTSMRIGTDGASPMQGELAKMLRIFLPATSLIFMYFQPGAVQLFFCTGSLLSLGQSLLIQNPIFRRATGLLPLLPKLAPGDTSADLVSPGGLKTWREPRGTQSIVDESSNVSVIDRFVDNAKARRARVFGGYTTMKDTVLGKTSDKQAERKKASVVEKAEAYEASRRMQTEWEKATRNKSKLSGSQGASGRGMINELVEKDDKRARTTSSKAGRRKR